MALTLLSTLGRRPLPAAPGLPLRAHPAGPGFRNWLLGSPAPRTERDTAKLSRALCLPRLLGHQTAASPPHRNPQSLGRIPRAPPTLGWGWGPGEPPSYRGWSSCFSPGAVPTGDSVHGLRGWGVLGRAPFGQPGGLWGDVSGPSWALLKPGSHFGSPVTLLLCCLLCHGKSKRALMMILGPTHRARAPLHGSLCCVPAAEPEKNQTGPSLFGAHRLVVPDDGSEIKQISSSHWA